jgi:hypothetical protein
MSNNRRHIISDGGVFFIGAASLALYYISRNKIKCLQDKTDSKTRPRRDTFHPAPSIQVASEENEKLQGQTMESVVLDDIRIHPIESLRDHFESSNSRNDSKRLFGNPYYKLISEDDFILGDIVRKGNRSRKCEAFVRGGPRAVCHFDTKSVRAAIVTCGGLCPGLNNVIREVVLTLHNLYEVESVIGIR